MNTYDPKLDPVGYKEFELGKKRSELLVELDKYRQEENWAAIADVSLELIEVDAQIELIAELWD
jgi:hypothetical protein